MAVKNSKQIEKTKRSKKNNHNKGYIRLAFIMVFIIILIIVLKSNKIVDVKYDKIQIILNNENITSNISKEIILENDKIYISLEDIRNYFDKTIYQEEGTGLIITTSDKKLACIKQDSDYITINSSKQNIQNAIIEKDGEKYLAISDLENVYDYEFQYSENSNIVTIDSLDRESIKAYVKKNIKIKKENKFFSNIIEKIPKGDTVIFISEENGIAKVRTQNGNIGYVKYKLLENFETQRENFVQNTENTIEDKFLEYNLTDKDISTFEKREKVINLILQEAIKNDKMNVKITYNKNDDFNFERFKIEAEPMLKECGIKINII